MAKTRFEEGRLYWRIVFDFGRHLFSKGETDQATWARNYRDYIASPTWKKRAEAAKKRAGYRCQLCNSDSVLHAHHRTYERLGCEKPADVIVLCSKCHKKFHEVK